MDITINELRTGNLLNYDTSEGDILPTKIDWQDLKWLDEDSKGFNLVHSPIHLTVESLINFGFKPERTPGVTRNYTISHGDSVLLANWNNSAKEIHSLGIIHPMIDNTLTNFVWHIKYVHELQNLFFALTGTELVLQERGQEKV